MAKNVKINFSPPRVALSRIFRNPFARLLADLLANVHRQERKKQRERTECIESDGKVSLEWKICKYMYSVSTHICARRAKEEERLTQSQLYFSSECFEICVYGLCVRTQIIIKYTPLASQQPAQRGECGGGINFIFTANGEKIMYHKGHP